MSKISQLHAELNEQAYKLGFESLGEAEQAGYGVDWENGKLVKVEDEQDKAHEAWLAEKSACLAGLVEASAYANRSTDYTAIKRAIKFIEGVSHE